ncbi:solute carrier family 25 protein [Sphaerosporella brunnea]|uniref:Solute carrier family 25 protein n=1 Tax=Sphaerosporella brunnea TaxID=1250544 RepID=A0A5J5F1V3_9PEZI|nr:solute carrier family 25 protein [Sphaerosporella brunnea]
MADFIAGYISGAASILLGSPLDIIKARLQVSTGNRAISSPQPYRFPTLLSTLQGTASPLLTYGALNALLFSAYNRSLPYLPSSLTGTFLAGCIGGLASFTLAAPTEAIKCRAQLSPHLSSWAVMRALLKSHGVRGLYIGGGVTAVRDAVGYGFYFATYEGAKPLFSAPEGQAAILVAGGVAGCATWASIYPLDVVKTRVQTQVLPERGEREGLLGERKGRAWHGGWSSWECARRAYAEGGAKVFFDGLGVCMARAFLVNAVQWAIYEYVMRQFREYAPEESRPVQASV